MVRVQGINLMTEKYAWMIESTYPAEYEQNRHKLSLLVLDWIDRVEQIHSYFKAWDHEI